MSEAAVLCFAHLFGKMDFENNNLFRLCPLKSAFKGTYWIFKKMNIILVKVLIIFDSECQIK